MGSRELALASTLTALAVALSPVHFAWGPTRAFPWQHMVNVVAGITLGPLWAAAIAFLVGTIRIAVGTGTVFAYPGGIPGGALVGLLYRLLSSRAGVSSKRIALIACSLAEPVGTVGVGGVITWHLMDPFLGGIFRARFGLFLYFAAGWLVSSLTGAALGLFIVLLLDRMGMLRM